LVEQWENLSVEEKARIADAFVRATGKSGLHGMIMYGEARLDVVLRETRILEDPQDALKRWANLDGWLRFSLASLSNILGHPFFLHVGNQWLKLPHEHRKGFEVAVWVTGGIGREGERELAIYLPSYAKHKAARSDMGAPDYVMCHYADRKTWHYVDARYDRASGLIQFYLAGWEALAHVSTDLYKYLRVAVTHLK
jgi:hypothetical protein